MNLLSTSSQHWTEGQWAIYRKSKRSAVPGPRAAGVQANSKGEQYSYVVDKFWVVRRVLESGEVELQTPGGKCHSVSQDDPNLRHPSLIERLIWRHRFARAETTLTPPSVSAH